jgi:chromosome segregation ATPase
VFYAITVAAFRSSLDEEVRRANQWSRNFDWKQTENAELTAKLDTLSEHLVAEKQRTEKLQEMLRAATASLHQTNEALSGEQLAVQKLQDEIRDLRDRLRGFCGEISEL